MMPTRDVIVVGGGLHGCSAALQLAARGLSVTVLEKDRVGRHASGVNAGGVRTLGRAVAELPLSVAAKQLWKRLPDLVDDDCGYRPTGQIRVAESEAELATLKLRSRAVASLGLDHAERVIDRSELYERVPALAPHCVGGLIVEDDGYANPYRTTLAFRRAAEARGVVFHEGDCVAGLRRSGTGLWQVSAGSERVEAPILVNCAGAWGGEIARKVGDEVALTASGSMMMITARMPPIVRPVIGAAGRRLSFKQFENGTVLIGGGHRAAVDLQRNTTAIDLAGLAKAARTVAELFPAMRSATVVRFWSGIEGFTSDHLPVIGPSPSAKGVFHAFGFSAHGFQLGPIVGKLIAELIVDGRCSLPVEPFRIDRFSPSPAFETKPASENILRSA